jgi:hypothetical protein
MHGILSLRNFLCYLCFLLFKAFLSFAFLMPSKKSACPPVATPPTVSGGQFFGAKRASTVICQVV